MKNIKATIILMAMLAGTITLSACGKVDSPDSANSSSTAEALISSETAASSVSAKKTETNDGNVIFDEETIFTEVSENEPDTEVETVFDNDNNNSPLSTAVRRIWIQLTS